MGRISSELSVKSDDLYYKVKVSGTQHKIMVELQVFDFTKPCKEDWQKYGKEFVGSNRAEIFRLMYLADDVLPMFVRLAANAFDLAEGAF